MAVAPATVTLPLMRRCILQWYPYVLPLILKVCEYLCPLRNTWERNVPLFAVTVCRARSLLIQMTLVPRLMVMWVGLKRKFWI